jgi:hypothetical protein
MSVTGAPPDALEQSGRDIAIENLLLNCAKLRAGTSVLFVNENESESANRATVEAIEARARALGAEVRSMWIDHVPGPEDMPAEVLDAVAASDVAVFTHNMGGLLRLRPVPGNGLVVHNYAGTDEIMDSPWTRVPYGLWERISGTIAREFAAAHEWRITDDRGTDLRGTIPEAERAAPAQSDGFTVSTFPIGTHRPTSAATMSGTLVLEWLVSSANHDVGEGFRLDSPVTAHVKDGRIVDLQGTSSDVARVREQLEHAAKVTGKDPYVLSSWHGGVNPQAFTAWSDVSDLSRWQTLVHNNPRMLHFHVVGEDTPGEISLPIVDATVTFDGAVFWERGRFALLDAPAVKAELAKWKTPEPPFELNPAIGI